MISRGQGVWFYSPLKWTWAVRSNRHWLDGYPLGRWRVIPEESPIWTPSQGGRPRKEGGHPSSGPFWPLLPSRGFWSLLDDRKLRGMLISLCKPDMWAFPSYFPITPCRNRQTPKLVEFCEIKPYVWVLVVFGSFSLFICWLYLVLKYRQQLSQAYLLLVLEQGWTQEFLQWFYALKVHMRSNKISSLG